MGIESSINKKKFFAVIILLVITSFAAFGRIAGNDFINFDDNKYITENNNIQEGLNCRSTKWTFQPLWLLTGIHLINIKIFLLKKH